MPYANARIAAAPAGVLALALAIAAIAAGTGHSVAHSWYPARCCSGQDCMQVDRIEVLDDGDMLFHAGSISVVVAAEFQRLPSPDDHTHVCVYRVGSGEYRPRCVFVPGLM